MKLKGLTKLALSGVALAAVAATLGTSTYAWYVSNSTATVSGLSGSTASASSGNLLVANLTQTDGAISETGDWSNAISTISLKQVTALNPVSKDTNAIKPASNPTGWHDKAKTAVELAKAYGYYAFGVWSTEKVKADITFGIENTTAAADFKFQTCYNSTGMGSANNKPTVNEKFTSDFVKAIKFDLIVLPLADATVTTMLATSPKGTYNAESCLNAGLGDAYAGPTHAPSGKMISGGDAHAYYKAITGENVTSGVIDGGEAGAGSDLASGKVTIDLPQVSSENVKYIVAIRYWLEGSDTDCFDSCNNQSFALNMSLEAKA